LSVPLFSDQIIRLFAACGSLPHAHQAFVDAPKATTFTWHAIIHAHVKSGNHFEAMNMYAKMQEDGIVPDKQVFSCLLTACGSLGTLWYGQIVHNQITMVLVEPCNPEPAILLKGKDCSHRFVEIRYVLIGNVPYLKAFLQ
jgi:pentatricopeptide repeat protein